MKTHVLGFPRMGVQRELKFALESYWKGNSTLDELSKISRELRLNHWSVQKKAGLSCVSTGDFSWYDHVLDTAVLLGVIPKRFRDLPSGGAELYFAMARGDQKKNIPAMEMTKWFDTNYHYIVPEIEADCSPRLSSSKIFEETREAVEAGFDVKPVLLGPISFLALAKDVDGFDRWSILPQLLAVYKEILTILSANCQWVQLDEPVLCSDMSEKERNHFTTAYQFLNSSNINIKILLTTYFDELDDNLDVALDSGCAGLHLDLVRGGKNLDEILNRFPENMILSAGIVEGRNIWRNDYAASLDILNKIQAKLGRDRMMLASSCSLLHCPETLECETKLDSEIKSWLAFASEKCQEIMELKTLVTEEAACDALQNNQFVIESRRQSRRVHNESVQKRCTEITDEMKHRKDSYALRKDAQRWLNLPLFPTTTIGSYPQTDEIRRHRNDFIKGSITEEAYNSFIENEIDKVVRKQEEIGLDVLVHGEPERNDMVKYFGDQLAGFCVTQNGWVQSYGSRCVKPPVIYGDVSRPHPMTIRWIQYAQSLTKKPLKGMLTGPVTILCWSFVRDDLDRSEVCQQIALAMRDEVCDLEKAGIHIIQIDEAALSEGCPIKAKNRPDYFRWAVGAFRLTTSGVENSTQIHSHMCYSEFNRMIHAIADMDADVISIESSRSKMELLEAFADFEYPNEIGPGVYDIHSPRIPSKEEIIDLLHKAVAWIPAERLWVNPDCGLKTRSWDEVVPSLENMVAAARTLRCEHQK
ncbi:MAG: 5-methyltetrahydropteroyltriglutamate--homocysteine S-methyltransferase [Planctomycetia bacterium]|nr:5-methyltetrahydropteroyltriglutamate--homocysteine S-methyltransferase [Planctomycetia bacterium]